MTTQPTTQGPEPYMLDEAKALLAIDTLHQVARTLDTIRERAIKMKAEAKKGYTGDEYGCSLQEADATLAVARTLKALRLLGWDGGPKDTNTNHQGENHEDA